MSYKKTEDPNLLENPVKKTPTDWGKWLRYGVSVAVILTFTGSIIYYGSNIFHRVEETGKDIKEVKSDLDKVESNVQELSEDVAYIKGQIEAADKYNGVAPTVLPSDRDSASQ